MNEKRNKKQNKQAKQELARLQTNRGLLKERTELLEAINSEMEGAKKLPSVPLGGIFDDLLKLNPERAEKLVPFLLENYKQEVLEVEALIAGLN